MSSHNDRPKEPMHAETKSRYPNLGQYQPTLIRAAIGNPQLPLKSPTVFAYQNFNAKDDAIELRAAVKGIGCKKDVIIDILANRSNAQRIEIGIAFKSLYGKDLKTKLKSKLSGNLKKTVKAMIMPSIEFYAKELHRAIAGFGTDEEVLVEILGTLTNNDIQAVSKSYKKSYGHTLEKDIKGVTSGHRKRLLVSLSMGNREELTDVDEHAVRSDAEALQNAREKIWGTKESEFKSILVTKDIKHLRAVFAHYQLLASKNIEASIKNEFSGDTRVGLLTLVKCIKNKFEFFAECLHKSMTGLGKNDKTLIRIIVSRSEIDLEDIKIAFENMYGKSLESKIIGNTSGDYKKLLLRLISQTTI